jgi:hypothetical protein
MIHLDVSESLGNVPIDRLQRDDVIEARFMRFMNLARAIRNDSGEDLRRAWMSGEDYSHGHSLIVSLQSIPPSRSSLRESEFITDPSP